MVRFRGYGAKSLQKKKNTPGKGNFQRPCQGFFYPPGRSNFVLTRSIARGRHTADMKRLRSGARVLRSNLFFVIAFTPTPNPKPSNCTIENTLMYSDGFPPLLNLHQSKRGDVVISTFLSFQKFLFFPSISKKNSSSHFDTQLHEDVLLTDHVFSQFLSLLPGFF